MLGFGSQLHRGLEVGEGFREHDHFGELHAEWSGEWNAKGLEEDFGEIGVLATPHPEINNIDLKRSYAKMWAWGPAKCQQCADALGKLSGSKLLYCSTLHRRTVGL